MGVVRRLLATAAAYLAVSLAAGAWFADRAVHRPRMVITDEDGRRAEDLAASLGAALETVSITARDGAKLDGWWLTPRQPNGHAVVLMHGIGSNRAGLLGTARLFVAHGYHAIVLDSRAHGSSGGDIVTFGALEADDATRWVEWIRARTPAGCVVLFGDSLGAGVALQASAAPGVCAVVAQSAFTSMGEIAVDRIGDTLRTGTRAGRSLFRPGIEMGWLYVRARYGVDVGGASALTALARPGPPVLLIHGGKDRNTPVHHAHALYRANPARVTLWIVAGGAHQGLAASSPDYERRIVEFVTSASARTARSR